MYTRWALLLVTASLVLMIGISKPRHNWDMIGYVAAAHYKDGYRGPQLLEKTYSEIRAEVSPKNFSTLTEGKYREAVFKDPRALEQQVPFYSIRMLYIELMRLLGLLGMTYAKSTYVLSAVFGSLCVVVLARFLIAEKLSLVMLPIIAGTAGILHLAALSSPDAMACFFSLLAVLGALSNKKYSLVLAAALPLVRTDFILLSCLMSLHAFLKGQRGGALVSLAAALTIYLAVNHFNGNYGWLTIFNFALIAMDPYPAELVPSRHLASYMKPYASALLEVLIDTHFVIYALAAYILAMKRKAALVDSSAVLLVFIPVAFVILHLMLFPTYERRFFVFSATLVFVWILRNLSMQRATAEATDARV